MKNIRGPLRSFFQKTELSVFPLSLHAMCFQFINRLGEAVPLGEEEVEGGFAFPGDTKTLQRHLCVCQLSRALGLHHLLDVEGKLRLIRELKAHYRHGIRFGKSNCFLFVTISFSLHLSVYLHRQAEFD